MSRNSRAEVIINVNWGRDAVLSVQAVAKQFGLTPKMKMVIPFGGPLPRQGEVGPELTEAARLRGPPTSGDARGQVPTRQDVRRRLPEEIRLHTSRMETQPRTPTCSSRTGRLAWSPRLAPFTRRTLSNSTRKGETFPSMVGGDVRFRPEDHQLIRPVVIVRGKAPKDMTNERGLLGRCSKSYPANRLSQKLGRLRLQSWQLPPD